MMYFVLTFSCALHVNAGPQQSRQRLDSVEPVIPLETVKKPARKKFGIGNRKAEDASSEPYVFEIEEAQQSAFLFLGKVGATLGVAGNSGSGVFAAVEVGYRLRLGAHAVGFSIAPEVGGAWQRQTLTPQVAATASTLRLRVPLLLSGNFAFGQHFVRASVGPSFDWFSRRASDAGLQVQDSYGALGLRVLGAYLHALGSGALGVEASYHLTRTAYRGSGAFDHSLSLALVYLFFF